MTRSVSRSSEASALASSSCRSVVGPGDVGGQQARHRRLRGRDRGAQVVADRVEQRGARAFGLGQRFDRARRLGELALPVGHRHLRGERGEDALVVAGQTPSAQHQRLVVVDLGDAVAVAPVVAAGSDRRAASTMPRTRRARARSRLTLRIPKVSCTRASNASSACSPRSRLPASVDSVSASALARDASADRRADRSTTRDTRTATSRNTPSARMFSRVGDRERVHRRREVEVQQQAAGDRRCQRGPEAADQAGDDDDQQVDATGRWRRRVRSRSAASTRCHDREQHGRGRDPGEPPLRR